MRFLQPKLLSLLFELTKLYNPFLFSKINIKYDEARDISNSKKINSINLTFRETRELGETLITKIG